MREVDKWEGAPVSNGRDDWRLDEFMERMLESREEKGVKDTITTEKVKKAIANKKKVRTGNIKAIHQEGKGGYESSHGTSAQKIRGGINKN